MTNDWIAFVSDGETHLDLVFCYGRNNRYAITSRNGKVSRSAIIETRAAAEREVEQ